MLQTDGAPPAPPHRPAGEPTRIAAHHRPDGCPPDGQDDARPLTEVFGTLAVRGVARDARRLGLVLTRGRDVEPLVPGGSAVPDWRLFGPAGLTGREALGRQLPQSDKDIRSIAIAGPWRYAPLGREVRMAKIMVSLPDEFLKKVDRTAKAQGRSRSELIREALRGVLTGSEGGQRSWKEALAPLKELEQQWVGRWDSTDIIRYYRETRYGREDRR